MTLAIALAARTGYAHQFLPKSNISDLALVYQGGTGPANYTDTTGKLVSYGYKADGSPVVPARPSTYWTKDDYKQLVAAKGDWLFDGFVFLELTNTASINPDNRTCFTGTSYVVDYLLNGCDLAGAGETDMTFALDHFFDGIQQLYLAIAETSMAIKAPPTPRQVYIGLPILPADNGNADRYMNRAIERWKARAYNSAYIHLAGFYYINENLVGSPEVVAALASTRVTLGRLNQSESMDLKFLEIPSYRGGARNADFVNQFDLAYLQPNTYQFDVPKYGQTLGSVMALAKSNGWGLEVEFDSRLLSDRAFQLRFASYLGAFAGNSPYNTNDGATGLPSPNSAQCVADSACRTSSMAYYMGNNELPGMARSTGSSAAAVAARFYYNALVNWIQYRHSH